jgi:two-component system LytT family response regulator
VRVLIVDDERLARSELRRLLAPHVEVEIVGEARDLADAEGQIAALAPELLLLDIEMPGGTGFELLTRLTRVPRVIFTTAYDAHALRAFEVGALDYLLKPIEPARLAQALEKVQRTLTLPSPTGARRHPERLFVRDGEHCFLVELAEVPLFESEGNYARLCLPGRQPLLPRSLTYLEEQLDPALFFRASRKHLVNLAHVARVEPGPGSTLVLVLRSGREVELSRRQSTRLREQMEP